MVPSQISVRPKYVPLVQRPECCAITCLQMVLYRRGNGLFDLEKLALFFDIRVHKDHLNSFNVRLRQLTSYNNDEGMKTVESAGRVNAFFRKNKIKLTARPVKHSQIPNLAKFITENLASGHDLWVEYKAHEIHKNALSSAYIHDGLVESFNRQKNEVTLVDPDPRHKPRVRVPLVVLKDAISARLGRETGFLVIE